MHRHWNVSFYYTKNGFWKVYSIVYSFIHSFVFVNAAGKTIALTEPSLQDNQSTAGPFFVFSSSDIDVSRRRRYVLVSPRHLVHFRKLRSERTLLPLELNGCRTSYPFHPDDQILRNQNEMEKDILKLLRGIFWLVFSRLHETQRVLKEKCYLHLRPINNKGKLWKKMPFIEHHMFVLCHLEFISAAATTGGVNVGPPLVTEWHHICVGLKSASLFLGSKEPVCLCCCGVKTVPSNDNPRVDAAPRADSSLPCRNTCRRDGACNNLGLFTDV